MNSIEQGGLRYYTRNENAMKYSCFLLLTMIIMTLSFAQRHEGGDSRTFHRSSPQQQLLPTAERKYSIGDFAHGGIVFWIDKTGRHGMVCAKVDQSAGAKWFPDPRGYALSKSADHYLRSSRKNTELIIAAQAEIGSTEPAYAARICHDLQITEGGATYDDWQLPSIRALNQIYIHRMTINAVATENGGTELAPANYWSSTSIGNQAWTQNFRNGIQGYYSKAFSYRVRAVRAF